MILKKVINPDTFEPGIYVRIGNKDIVFNSEELNQLRNFTKDLWVDIGHKDGNLKS